MSFRESLLCGNSSLREISPYQYVRNPNILRERRYDISIRRYCCQIQLHSVPLFRESQCDVLKIQYKNFNTKF